MNIKKEHLAIASIPFLFLILFFLGTTKESLPPIDIAGHTESYPNSRVMRDPIPIETHKHILEHTPAGEGGVIINYNCEDFECSPDLIKNLESFAYKYRNVYIAPFKGMKAKIVVSKYSQRLVLDEYDENKIINFIEGGSQ